MSMETPINNRLARLMELYAKAQYAMAGALLFGVALYFAFIYRPQSQRLADLNEQIDQRRTELDSDRTRTDRLPRVAIELQNLKTRLANFKKLPPEPQLGQFVHEIDQVSQRAGLAEPTVVPGATQTDELFSEQPIALTFRGDFSKVFNFIHQVEDMDRLTRVGDVSLKTIGDQPGAVDVTMSVTIYYAED